MSLDLNEKELLFNEAVNELTKEIEDKEKKLNIFKMRVNILQAEINALIAKKNKYTFVKEEVKVLIAEAIEAEEKLLVKE